MTSQCFWSPVEGDCLQVQEFSPHEYNQRWYLAGDSIRHSENTNWVLDIAACCEDAGAKVCAYDYHGGDNQHWTFNYLWVGSVCEGGSYGVVGRGCAVSQILENKTAPTSGLQHQCCLESTEDFIVETKWPPFCRPNFERNFLRWKLLYSASNFTEIYSTGSN